ncbi:MAG: hypothetical protein ACP5FH_05885 [Terracidiphilus sp.]
MSAKRFPLWNSTIAPPSAEPPAAAEPATGQAPFAAEAFATETFVGETGERLVPPAAVLVFHGIGEEVRFETLSRAASLILKEAGERGARNISVVIRPVQKDAASSGLAVRTELGWREAGGAERRVHVYEAYWAPLTVGKVSYMETIRFLLESGWNGVRGTVLSGRFGTFRRWLFGSFKTLRTSAGTAPLLIVLIAMVGFFWATAALAAYSLAGAAKRAAAGGREGLAGAANFVFHQVAAPWNRMVRIFGDVLGYFVYFPDGPQFLNHVKFDTVLSRAHLGQGILALLLWAVVIYVALRMRSLLTLYAGSVAAYLSPYKDSRFEDLRNRIQKVGLDAARLIYDGHTLASGWIPKYEKVVILGHSLGSVIAYDTLNAMINLEAAKNKAGAPNGVVERTAALITFGSPLDKTAFLFRVQLDPRRNRMDPGGELRETMVCAVQPLITSYSRYRFNPDAEPHGPKWINLWSPMDVISGRLDYYDDPAVGRQAPAHVQNLIDPEARIPILAHTQYWTKRLLRGTVYDALF